MSDRALGRLAVTLAGATAAAAAPLVALACASCGSSAAPSSAGVPQDAGAEAADADVVADATRPGTQGGARVYAVFDLPRGATTRTLSGAAWDESTRMLWTVPDRNARLVPLRASEDFRSFTPAAPIALRGRTSSLWDGEGIARVGTELFVVTEETTPSVERFDATGNRLSAVSLPARFASQAAGNKGLESLAASPNGRYLFTANESALTTDGPRASKSIGTRIRILRHELASGANEEHGYVTEPLGAGTGDGDMGVSDVAALSDDELLVLERGYQSGYGNTVRIFRVKLAPASRVDALDALEPSSPALAKTLLVDIERLPPGAVTHPATQPNPLLDNYEAIALGPAIAGERLVFLVSDDNESDEQVSRVLVLAMRGL